MSKTFSNVLAVPIFWIALLSIVHKTGALTISSWISVACIARQSNWQLHNSMLFNVVMQLSFECGYLAVEMALLAAIVFGAICGFTRYYNSDVSKRDMELLPYLRQLAYREIIRLLLNDASDLFAIQKIAQMIGKTPSTVSVELGRLINHKVVSFDEKHGYTVNNKQTTKKLISKYKV